MGGSILNDHGGSFLGCHYEEAKAQAKMFIEEHHELYPALVRCMEKDLKTCIAYMNHPHTLHTASSSNEIWEGKPINGF